MKRRKRFTIKLVALGFALAALSATPAQAKLDEGLNGLQPSYTPRLFMAGHTQRPSPLRAESLVTADDIARPSPQRVDALVTADDVTHPSQVPSQPTVVQTDDGFEVGTLGISAIVLLLVAGAGFVAIQQIQNRKLASA